MRAGATAPGIWNQRGQARPVRSVMVIDRLKFRIPGTAHSGPAHTDTAGRRHGGVTFLLPTALDLSYLHLSRLPVQRIRRAHRRDHEGIVCHASAWPKRDRWG